MEQHTQNSQPAAEQPARGPEASFRHEAIGGSIWRQAGKNGDFFSFTLSRAWKSDESGKSGYSQNFLERNSADLKNTIDDCVNWIQANSSPTAQQPSN